MDKRKMVVQLAGRMGVAEETAEEWLQAVMDLLHQAYAGSAARGATIEDTPVSQPPLAGKDVPVLRPLTPAARSAIGDELPLDRFPFRVGRYDVALDRFPFRVGREGRGQIGASGRGFNERRCASAKKNNELYVKDAGKTINVSREHFQIELEPDGSYELVDRGSACGTIVQNRVIGGNHLGGRCPLAYGDAIIVGTRNSEIVFEFSASGA